MVHLKPKLGASKRTKNRIREHREFEPKGSPRTGVAFCRRGLEWQLFECPDGWVGWLPTSEFEEVS